MKHLLAALALCVTTSTQSAEISYVMPLENPKPAEEPTIEPDLSMITIEHARTYVQSIYPYAVAVQQAHKIPAAITLAIACLESGYGRSYNAKEKYNHLGIRVYQNGKAGYRRFSSTEACFDYYANLFTKPRYAPLQDLETKDLQVWVKTLQECGYNRRATYIKKVMQMVRFIHLDEIQYPVA